MTVAFAAALGCLLLAVPVALLRARLGALLATAGCVLLVIVGVAGAVGAARPGLDLGTWLGFGHSHLRADGLAGIFLVLVGLTGGATSLAYAADRAGRRVTALGSALLLFVVLVLTSDNAFLFFLGWELLSVCIYLIASAEQSDPGALLGGYFTGGMTKLGGAALLGAFGLMYGHTHTFSMLAWAHASLPPGTRGVVFALLLLAFGTKVGLLPVQGGLPAGYASAPRLGAASLSVALSAGFYGLWRFQLQILAPLPGWCGDALLVIGAATAIAGIVYAVTQDDLRTFLGYSTIEHAGIVMLGLGVAVLGQGAHDQTLAAAGLLAATLHVCAHNLAKTLALISVGQVELESGERRLDPLGGLGRSSPGTGFSLGVAALTLAAIPPLGGFVSEWFTLEALLQGFRMPTLLSQLLCALGAAALAFTAGVGLLAFAKYYGFIFLGPARNAWSPAASWPRAWDRVSIWPLGLLILGLGALAPWEVQGIGDALSPLLGFDLAHAALSAHLVLGPVFTHFSVLAPTWLSLVLPGFALIALAIGRLSGGTRRVRRAPVWVTGSTAELRRVQYRPSAYSNPIRHVLRGPLGFRTQVVSGPDGEDVVREASVVLAVDRLLYRPLTWAALSASDQVRRLQSGRLSGYLLYLLVALIAALALIPILH